MHKEVYQFGVSEEFDCPYLKDQKERLLVAVDKDLHSKQSYSKLIGLGFRRSGEHIYRPHCKNCDACQSVRIASDAFKPTKSQKRILKKTAHLNTLWFNSPLGEQQLKDYYQLYERYIRIRHHDGSMYPPSQSQFDSLLESVWLDCAFLEIHDGDKRIAVSIVDCLDNALSAVYTFFEPSYADYSLGTLAILKLIETACEKGYRYLYLGYQVDECDKMNYKSRFFPHQRLIKNHWINVEKTT